MELDDGSSLAHLRRTLYWSDVAQGGYGIFRCYLHVTIDDHRNGSSSSDGGFVVSPEDPSCSQVERVLDPASGAQEKIRDITVVPVRCALGAHGSVEVSSSNTANDCDMVYFLDARTDAVWRLLLPPLSPDNVYDLAHSSPIYAFPATVPLDASATTATPSAASEVGLPVQVSTWS